MSARIGLLGSKGTTLDFLAAFEAETGHKITHLFTLSDQSASAGAVAYYSRDAILAAAGGLETHEIQSYTLSDEGDRAAFAAAELDVLFVIGWERLVPPAVLTSVKRGVYGMHGSPFGLPKGRGRSPLNWSILQGHGHFVTSLFRYSAGVDDGDILDSQVFSVTDRDDIGVLHLKNRLAMLKLAARHLPRILDGSAVHMPQPDEPPSFYPKRTPEDGGIHWSASTEVIDRLVRAVAPPYPGAFCPWRGGRLTIVSGQPFEKAMFPSGIEPGTILDVSPSMDMFVVKTGDGSYLVRSYEGERVGAGDRGQRLDSAGTQWTEEVLAARYGPGQTPDQWEVRPERKS
jgi:UDP-4-amino-4-deoxy-L-arabinose formyltransferase/UDP-glucuronic acid dehydrogenase (UDP-4-keto-hexauronic acid decarboxylating)